jgi:hypothetical protein
VFAFLAAEFILIRRAIACIICNASLECAAGAAASHGRLAESARSSLPISLFNGRNCGATRHAAGPQPGRLCHKKGPPNRRRCALGEKPDCKIRPIIDSQYFLHIILFYPRSLAGLGFTTDDNIHDRALTPIHLSLCLAGVRHASYPPDCEKLSVVFCLKENKP